jgi:hypothetical protein
VAKLTNKAIIAMKELPPLTKIGALPNHEEGRVISEIKKTVHAQEVRTVPWKPRLQAAARRSKTYSPRK